MITLRSCLFNEGSDPGNTTIHADRVNNENVNKDKVSINLLFFSSLADVSNVYRVDAVEFLRCNNEVKSMEHSMTVVKCLNVNC